MSRKMKPIFDKPWMFLAVGGAGVVMSIILRAVLGFGETIEVNDFAKFDEIAVLAVASVAIALWPFLKRGYHFIKGGSK